ncbi:NAD(P)H-dependent glycerol-3-phosphate dehydrogenase [bacterium]|nr:NAD(P)H-dependent glycerol-3-phosphate dehydrogenase [bacterium]RQV97946.1 MAG: NAD(P)H-dependent glycerol-3-phosphate dehydrogenase [bacterium]
MNSEVGILGAGGWGTALAIALAHNHHDVTLWEFNPKIKAQLEATRENSVFLPGISIPEDIKITQDLTVAVQDKAFVVIALPSHVIRSVAEKCQPILSDQCILVSGSKGLENMTWKRISEILLESLPNLTPDRVVVLSGPSHAEELARKRPTVIVAASEGDISSREVQKLFMSPFFRIYTSDDVIGVELGGALKNVIAIAAGIIDGLELGDNLKAALINRGLVEITRLGTALNANSMTFAGLSGMGDLIVTCTSRHSRNRFVGEEIARGKGLRQILKEMVMVAEGVRTTQSALDLSLHHKIDMPITTEVFHVLFEDKSPRQAVSDLMTRTAKAEDWG